MSSIIENLKKALDLLADHMIRVRSNLAIIEGLKEATGIFIVECQNELIDGD